MEVVEVKDCARQYGKHANLVTTALQMLDHGLTMVSWAVTETETLKKLWSPKKWWSPHLLYMLFGDSRHVETKCGLTLANFDITPSLLDSNNFPACLSFLFNSSIIGPPTLHKANPSTRNSAESATRTWAFPHHHSAPDVTRFSIRWNRLFGMTQNPMKTTMLTHLL